MLFFTDKVVFKGLIFDLIMLMPYNSVVSLPNFELSSWFNRYTRINMPVVMSGLKAHVGTSIFNNHV